MPFSKEREYRAFFDMEATDGDDYVVEGWATTFDEPYELEGYDGELEIIEEAALDGADMTDVIMQYDHSGIVMARTRNNTLQLAVIDHKLHFRADLKGCQAGRDLYEAVRNRLVDRMSWGFLVNREEGWSYDPATRTQTIRKIDKVYDVSAVSIPANQGTQIHKRSAFLDGAIEEAKQELLERKAIQRARTALKAKAIEIRRDKETK